MIGETISHYKILEKLGGGGMGVVYKAEDTNLNRNVALKFLPPELTSDPEAKKRFIHEAQAASSLEHPNICDIHDIAEDDGQLFIVMSCYDGGSLKDRIAKGVLKIEEAIEITMQVCQGLQKAHENGIIHRDIKPANIMLTKDGLAKIVDFGLAKLTGKSKLTKSGSTVGTAAYMSPEQARSEAVDARTDIWSLGVLLYEMITAHLPFRGDHEAALMYSIVHEEPQPIEKFRQDVPMELVHIIRRALEKEAENRYQNLSELIIELRRLKRDTSRISTGMYVVSSKTKLSAKTIVLISATAILFLAVLYGVYKILLRPSGPFQATFTKQTDFAGAEGVPDISPDGKFILYSRDVERTNSVDLFLQRTGGGNPINLTKDSNGWNYMGAFSPDGQWITFHSDRQGKCGLYVMGATGESLRRLADFGYSPSWSYDGKEIVVSTVYDMEPATKYNPSNGELWAIQVSTGEKRLITKEGDAQLPSCSPHGYRIAYWGKPTESGRRGIVTIPYGGGEVMPVTTDSSINWNPAWSPDGEYLYFLSNRGGNLNVWRVAIDEKSGEVLGEPEAVTTPSAAVEDLRFSRNSNIFIYINKETRYETYRLDFDPATERINGMPVPVIQGTKKLQYIGPSPDGEWLAYAQMEPQEDLFVIRKDGSGMRQLTNDRFNDRGPAWSPDGKRIAFFSNRSGKNEIWMVNEDGGGLQQITDLVKEVPVYPHWFPDGKRLAVLNFNDGSTRIIDLGKPLPLREVQTLPCQDTLIKRFFTNSVSADGNMLAGFVGTSVYIYNMKTQKLQREAKPGFWGLWLNDNRRFLYSSTGMDIRIYDMKTKKSREITKVTSAGFRDLRISADSGKIYYLTKSDEADIWTATVK